MIIYKQYSSRYRLGALRETGGFPPCEMLRQRMFGSLDDRTADAMQRVARPRSDIKAWARFAVGAVVAGIAVAWLVLPVSAWAQALRDWLLGLGLSGVAAFAAIYVLGAVVLAPEALLTIVAGFAYGFWGLPVVVVAATLGAALAFLIARHLARDTVRQLLEKRRNIAAIDKAVAEEGWKIVALLRLSPLIPFNLQNYLFGLTEIPFWHFVAATFVGIIPGAVLYIYIGVLGDAAGATGPAHWILLAAGLLATTAVVVLVARKARGKLRAAGAISDPAA